MIDDGLDLNIKKAYMLMYTFSNDKDIHSYSYIERKTDCTRICVCVHYIDAVKKKNEERKKSMISFEWYDK